MALLRLLFCVFSFNDSSLASHYSCCSVFATFQLKHIFVLHFVVISLKIAPLFRYWNVLRDCGAIVFILAMRVLCIFRAKFTFFWCDQPANLIHNIRTQKIMKMAKVNLGSFVHFLLHRNAHVNKTVRQAINAWLRSAGFCNQC